jgi:hypothetical protein
MNKESRFPTTALSVLVLAADMHRLLLLLAAACLLMACGTTGAAQSQGVQDAPAASAPTEAVPEYPAPMRGVWMPEDVGCSDPLNYDSEVLLSVGADMLGQYENTAKPLRVETIGEHPPAWRILSTFSPGTGEYEGSESIVYSVDGDTMIIDNGKAKAVFTRCK